MQTLTLIAPDRSERQRAALQTLRDAIFDIAGGFSEYNGFGQWKDGDGKIVAEPHVRIEVAVEDGRAAMLTQAFRQFGLDAGEESLYYLYNGHPMFESPNADAAEVAV